MNTIRHDMTPSHRFVIANNAESVCYRRRSLRRWVLWFGQISPTYVIVHTKGDDLCAALEEAVSAIEDSHPGVFGEPDWEEYKRLALEEDPTLDDERLDEAAWSLADEEWDSIDGGLWIGKDDWGIALSPEASRADVTALRDEILSRDWESPHSDAATARFKKGQVK